MQWHLIHYTFLLISNVFQILNIITILSDFFFYFLFSFHFLNWSCSVTCQLSLNTYGLRLIYRSFWIRLHKLEVRKESVCQLALLPLEEQKRSHLWPRGTQYLRTQRTVCLESLLGLFCLLHQLSLNPTPATSDTAISCTHLALSGLQVTRWS